MQLVFNKGKKQVDITDLESKKKRFELTKRFLTLNYSNQVRISLF